MKTQDVATDALLKLSDEIKKAVSFSSFTESQWRLAYLHGMAFFESASCSIAAIQFVDTVSSIIDTNTVGIDDEEFAKFNSIIEATIRARTELHQFADEKRAELDEHRMRRASIKSRI